MFPWPKIKPAVRVKLESIIADFSLAMPEEQVTEPQLLRVVWLVMLVGLLGVFPLPCHTTGADVRCWCVEFMDSFVMIWVAPQH